MPSLDNLNTIFKDDRFDVIMINVQEEKDTVENFIKKGGYSFTVYLDSNAEATILYNIRAHPKSFLIDPKGRVIGFAEGYREWDSDAMIYLVESLIRSNKKEAYHSSSKRS